MQHVLCPLAAILDQKQREDDAAVYGAQNMPLVPLRPNTATVWIMALVWFVSFVLALVGMFKAFSCGPVSTNFGLTGTGWGVIILVLGLLVTPVGGLLGIAFAFGGACAPRLMQF